MSRNDCEVVNAGRAPMAGPTFAKSVLTDVDEPTFRKGDIPSLDGLRAISIVLVLAGHAIIGGPHSFTFRVLFLHSDLGVRVFFVISGFLITSLLTKERAQFGSISLRLFYIRRALRILPAFFLFVVSVALLSILGITHVPAWSWLYVLTYTVNFAPFPPFPWVIIHLWSLSVEEQFYLLWPVVMKWGTPRTCAAVAILAVFTNLSAHIFNKLTGITFPGYGPFPYVCGPIAMGCLLALEARRFKSWIVSSSFLSDGRVLLLTWVLIALLDTSMPTSGVAPVFLGIIANSLMTFCVARLVFIPTGLVGRALNSEPVALLGRLSYSLYLWQQLFLHPSHAPISTPFPVNLVLTFTAACASYWGLEARFLGLRKKFRKATASGCM